MAKDAKLNADEAKELERLLAEEGIAPTTGAPTAGGLVGKLSANPYVAKVVEYVQTHQKQAIIIGVAFLLLLIAGGAGLYFLFKTEAPVEVKSESTPATKEEVEEVVVQKVNSYKLDPFFIPLMHNNEETGEFVTIAPTLLLSNNKLDREISKNLSILRKNIYYILKKKSPEDFKGDKRKLEERLKKEILTTANTLLLSGTGTVTDVFFVQFVVK